MQTFLSRRSFFALCSGAAAAAVAAPLLRTSAAPASEPIRYTSTVGTYTRTGDVVTTRIRVAYREHLGREATDAEVQTWLQ